MKENIETFNNQYDFIFKKYKDIKELREKCNKEETKFLYLFDIDYYNQTSTKLPENTCKLGMTIKPICMRLNGYPVNANIRNIEFIQCDYPDKKERLVKAFLKHKTEFKPIAGSEYYTNCNYLIKFIYIIIYNISENDIHIAYNYYDKKDEKYNILLNYIYSTYLEVLKDKSFKLPNKIFLYDDTYNYSNVDNNMIIADNQINEEDTNQYTNGSFVCEYCKKEYTTLSNLKHHQKTAQFCLDLQNQLSATFKCEHCEKMFSSNKYLKQHYSHCKIYKIFNENANLKKEIEELKNKFKLEINEELIKIKDENKEIKLKLEFKDQTILLKDETITKLEKENEKYQKLITRPTTCYNNTTNTYYKIQFNQLLEQIEVLNSENIAKRLNDINMVEFTDNCIKNFENTLTTSLSNVFKNFTFCTDKARRTVVIKNEEGKTEKVTIDDFVKMGLTLGVIDIINFIKEIEVINNIKNTDDNKEVYNIYYKKLQDTKEYVIASKEQNQVYFSQNKHPLPSLAKTILSCCAHLQKNR
jgi:hypothetical protein